MYYLAKYPEELKKARIEVDRVLGPRSANEELSIGADKIHELEYCKAILFETMRVRTPVVGVDRYPTRDTEIDGVKVYAGQNSAVGKFDWLFPNKEVLSQLRENTTTTQFFRGSSPNVINL